MVERNIGLFLWRSDRGLNDRANEIGEANESVGGSVLAHWVDFKIELRSRWRRGGRVGWG